LYIVYVDYFYKSTLSGLQLLVAPISGAIIGTLEGSVLGLLWGIKPPRMTLWWLMTVVAAVGLILGLLAFSPFLGVMALALPIMMAVPLQIAEPDRLWVVKCIFGGGLSGLLAGTFGGPIVVICYMQSMNYFYEKTFSGLELFLAPVLGGIIGTLEGLVLGLLWGIKPPRVTLWWLMAAVAAVGLILGLFALGSFFGMMALTLPFMMAVPLKVAAVWREMGRRDVPKERELAPCPQSTVWLYEGNRRWQEPSEMGANPEP
jgi:hypothetical protein